MCVCVDITNHIPYCTCSGTINPSIRVCSSPSYYTFPTFSCTWFCFSKQLALFVGVNVPPFTTLETLHVPHFNTKWLVTNVHAFSVAIVTTNDITNQQNFKAENLLFSGSRPSFFLPFKLKSRFRPITSSMFVSLYWVAKCMRPDPSSNNIPLSKPGGGSYIKLSGLAFPISSLRDTTIT